MPPKAKPPGFDTPLVKMTFPDELVDSDIREQFIYAHNQFIEAKRKQYEETKNPMFVWDALRSCLAYTGNPDGITGPSMIQSGHPLPKWIHDYLLEASASIVETKDGDIEQVAKFLGFIPPKRQSGGRSFFTQYHDFMRRHYMLSHLISLMKTNPELTVEQACFKIINRTKDVGIDGHTLKKWYDQSNKGKKAI